MKELIGEKVKIDDIRFADDAKGRVEGIADEEEGILNVSLESEPFPVKVENLTVVEEE